jgi:hypothetical protein
MRGGVDQTVTRRFWSRVTRRSVLYGNVLGLTPVIVYQMGKVGSMSIFATLQRSGLPVFHVHRMSAPYLARILAERRALGWNVPPIHAHQRMGLTVHAKIIAAGRGAKIVTFVRDPIARNLSGYFHSLDRIWNIANAHEAISIDDLCRGFLERFTHDEPLTWFDDEFHPVLGIDVYAHPFPARGHTTIHTDQVDVLIMRSELHDDEKHRILSAFLGKSIAPLQPENVTRDQSKGAVYEQFRGAIRLPEEYVSRMRGSRYYRHFYGSE